MRRKSNRLNNLAARTPVETSAQIRRRVETARDRPLARFRHLPGVFANAHTGPRELARFVPLDGATEAVLKGAIVTLGLSARAYHRVLKLARTLADLAGVDDVGPGQVAEAIHYRVLDRGTEAAGANAAAG